MGSDTLSTRASWSFEIHPLWQVCVKAGKGHCTVQHLALLAQASSQRSERSGRNVGEALQKLLKGFGRAGLPGLGDTGFRIQRLETMARCITTWSLPGRVLLTLSDSFQTKRRQSWLA